MYYNGLKHSLYHLYASKETHQQEEKEEQQQKKVRAKPTPFSTDTGKGLF